MNRRPIVVWAVLVLSAACAAQIRGVPASVNSPGNNDFFTRGIPASVSSLGPQGYGRPVFNPDFVPLSPPRRNRQGRVVMPTPVPLFYGVPYAVVVVPVPMEEVVVSERRAPEPQKIIVEIRDARPAPPADVAPKEIEIKPAPRQEVELPRPATVFIFQDGSRKELKDFAITPTELIDLSDGLIRRSPLGALDRAATRKVNAEQGVEVHFPASSSE